MRVQHHVVHTGPSHSTRGSALVLHTDSRQISRGSHKSGGCWRGSCDTARGSCDTAVRFHVVGIIGQPSAEGLIRQR